MRPLLAATVEDTETLRYPLLASPKLDGIRAIVLQGCVLSRSMKPLPNMHVQDLFGRKELNFLDGELIVGPPQGKDSYRRTMSSVMSDSGSVDGISFHVFDHVEQQQDPFRTRLKKATDSTWPLVTPVDHVICRSPEALDFLETSWVACGYEGVMLRDPQGFYKQGRSTLKEGILMKLKKFVDSEATVIGYTELFHNANAPKESELGYKVRQSLKENMVRMDTLGALQVNWNGVNFSIGTGFDAVTRKELWQSKENLVGKSVKFKYLEVGMKVAPRHPVFLGFRDKLDT